MPGKNHFQLKWCDIPDFCSWLRPCSDKCLAHCSVCKKDFRIDNAGVANVRSHAKGKGHISAIKLQAKNKQLSIQTMMCGKSTGGAESAFSRYPFVKHDRGNLACPQSVEAVRCGCWGGWRPQ